VRGETAQHVAVRTLDVETVRRVWGAGCQTGIKDRRGRSALDLVQIVTSDTKVQFRMKSVLNKPQVLLKPKVAKKKSMETAAAAAAATADAAAAAVADAEAASAAADAKPAGQQPDPDHGDQDREDHQEQRVMAVPNLDDIPDIGGESLDLDALGNSSKDTAAASRRDKDGQQPKESGSAAAAAKPPMTTATTTRPRPQSAAPLRQPAPPPPKPRITKGGGAGEVVVQDPTFKRRPWRPESAKKAVRPSTASGQAARRLLEDALASRDIAYLERTVEQAVVLGDNKTLRAACVVLESHFAAQRALEQERAERDERLRGWHEAKRRQRAEEARRLREREAEEADRRRREREARRRQELEIQERERAWQ
jgi:hypothetical protein